MLYPPFPYSLVHRPIISSSWIRTPSSWFPSVTQLGCTLWGRPNNSIFRVPGDSLSMIPYISSGLCEVALTSATMTSESRPRLSLGQFPFIPTRQCSLPWFSQCPVRPVRIIRCNWNYFRIIFSLLLFTSSLNKCKVSIIRGK